MSTESQKPTFEGIEKAADNLIFLSSKYGEITARDYSLLEERRLDVTKQKAKLLKLIRAYGCNHD